MEIEGFGAEEWYPPVASVSLCARRSAHLVAEALIASMDDGQRRVVRLPHAVQVPEASSEGGVAR